MENIKDTDSFKKLNFETLTVTQFRIKGEPSYAGGTGVRIKDNKLKIEMTCEAKDSCRFNKNICLVGLVAMTKAIESGIYDSDL